MADLVCVDPARVHEFWPHVKRMILSAVERTNLGDPQDLEYDILNGDQLLWIVWDGEAILAAASTHLVTIGGQIVCIITACGGEDMKHWHPLISGIEKYAKDERAACVRIYGRRGWGRVLSGYQQTHVILERTL